MCVLVYFLYAGGLGLIVLNIFRLFADFSGFGKGHGLYVVTLIFVLLFFFNIVFITGP